jgi:hypothetical protein
VVTRSLVFGLLLAACGGRSERVIPARCGPGRDLGVAEADAARALCERAVRCGHYVDVAACERVTLRHEFFEDAESGCVRYHPERLPACLAALREAGCGLSDLEDTAEACRGPFEGVLSEDERCASDVECRSGSCRQPLCDESCCTMLCSGRDRPVGAPCEHNEDCVEDAFCEEGACTPRRPEGARCLTAGAASCVRPLWCIVGVCTVPPRVGDACNRSAFFISCDDSRDFCDDVTLKCVRVSPVGAPCGEAGDGCVNQAVCRNGTCVPLPELGSPCEGDRCLGDLVCGEDDRCAAPSPDPEGSPNACSSP